MNAAQVFFPFGFVSYDFFNLPDGGLLPPGVDVADIRYFYIIQLSQCLQEGRETAVTADHGHPDAVVGAYYVAVAASCGGKPSER